MTQSVARPEYREVRDGFYWTQECLRLGTLNELEQFDMGSWLDADEEVHGCQNAFLISDERSLLFDTLTQPNEGEVVGLLDTLLDGDDLDYLVISHPEANHAGNTFSILEAYPDATLLVPGDAAGHGDGYGAEHELYHVATDTPEDVDQLPNEVRSVTDGDTVDLGEYTVDFREPAFADHAFTLWMTERRTNTLFTVDWLGFLHQSGNCTAFAGEMDREVTVEQLFRFHALAFPWLRFSDIEAIRDAVDGVRRRFDPDIVAPAHGMVVEDAADTYMDLFIDAAERLSKEGEPDNMRSKLEYILRAPTEVGQ